MDPRETLAFIRWHLDDPRFPPTRLALDSGLSRGALNGLFSDDPLKFNPRYSTLLRLYENIPDFRKKEWLGLMPVGKDVIEKRTIAVRRYATARGILYERSFEAAGVVDLEPRQLAAAWRYVEKRRSGEGLAPHELEVDVLRSLAPDAAVHIVDVASNDPYGFTALVWDSGTGFEGGRDFTGLAVRDILDDAYAQAVAERYRQAARSGTGLLSFVHRMGPDGIRTFFRLLVPLFGDPARPFLLAISLPQRPGSELLMFPEADLWRWKDGRSSRARSAAPA